MTQYPGPQYPGPQYPAPSPGAIGYAQPGPVRPTVVTVLAIFGIIFGIFGLLIKTCGVAVMFIPQMANVPGMEFQKDMLAWNVANTAIGLAISTLLLAGSIGSLSLKPWARRAMLIYAALAVLMTLANLVVGLVWVVPKIQAAQQQAMSQQSGGNVPPAQMTTAIKTASLVSLVVAAIVQLVFPAILAFCYTRPNVKAAFGDASMHGGASGYGADPYGYYAQASPPSSPSAPPPPPVSHRHE